jgi:hypothetical protein
MTLIRAAGISSSNEEDVTFYYQLHHNQTNYVLEYI